MTMQPMPPMPPHKLPFGHLWELRKNVLDRFTQDWLRFGDVIHYRIGPKKIYIISTPELVQDVLITRREEFVKHYMLGDQTIALKLVFGEGLLTTSSEEAWFVQRRMLQPMFHRQYLTTLGSKMVASGQRLLDHWESTFQPHQVINIHHEMTRVTLDIINTTMFSAHVDYEADALGDTMHIAAAYVAKRMLSAVKLPLIIPTPGRQRFRKAMRSLEHVVTEIINQRRASSEQYDDLLGKLLAAQDVESGQGMSDQQLRDEIATMFGAGHDTTAYSLTWAWYLLAQYPQVQAEFFKQIDSVLQGRSPTINDLEQIPLAAAIFNETLRLYPSAPLVIRIAPQRTELGGYQIGAGSQIIIDLQNVQRHPDYWENPHIFNPARWTVEQTRKRHKHAFMPFGAGPHMCIGNNLALLEGSLLLTMIAQRYRFACIATTNGTSEFVITLRPKYGMQLELIPR